MSWKNKYRSVIIGIASLMMISGCEKERGHHHEAASDSIALAWLVRSPGEVVFSRQTTIPFGDTFASDSVVLYGIIVPDERRTDFISARFSGRVEKLYVHFPNQYVKQGQKLMDIYSPEITTTLGEHQLLFSMDSGATLTQESRKRLLLLGVPSVLIEQTERTGIIPDRIPVYSPYSGYIIAVNEAVSERPSKTGMTAMDRGSPRQKPTQSSPVLLEGSYVIAGQTLFAVNDGSEIVALISTDPSTANALNAGQEITVQSESDRSVRHQGKVSLIEPALQTDQRLINIRVDLPNRNGQLKFNSLVTATLGFRSSGGSLPAACVYDLGQKSIVWVKAGTVDSVNIFTPRIVQVGVTANGVTEILSGLRIGEEVASQAGMLSDREGIIRTGTE
jgi:membrane fusion protein, copper/silver efflux system